jgi:hypothetical protein
MNSSTGFGRMTDSMSQGALYPGRAATIVMGFILIAMLLRLA